VGINWAMHILIRPWCQGGAQLICMTLLHSGKGWENGVFENFDVLYLYFVFEKRYVRVQMECIPAALLSQERSKHLVLATPLKHINIILKCQKTMHPI